jgi:hypothetical protein
MKLKAHTIAADSTSMHSYFIALALALAGHSKYSNAYIDFGLNEANNNALVNVADWMFWITSIDAYIVFVKPVWRLYDNTPIGVPIKISTQDNARALSLNFYLRSNLICHNFLMQ